MSRNIVSIFVVAAIIAGGCAMAYLEPNGPLLAWWLTWALVTSTYVAFSGATVGLAARARQLVYLHSVLAFFALGTTWFAARQLTSAVHLRFDGVYIERSDSISIASGQSGVDVVFPVLTETQLPWRLRLRKVKDGWEFLPDPQVEQVRISSVLSRAATHHFDVVNGVVLDSAGARFVVHAINTSTTDTIALRSTDGQSFLESRMFGRYEFSPVNERLTSRVNRALQNGTLIGTLEGKRSASAPFDRFIRVERLSPTDVVNGDHATALDRSLYVASVPSWLHRPAERVLISAGYPFRVEALDSVHAAPVIVRDSARVEVRHSGGIWRFDVVVRSRARLSHPGLAIRFVRNPRRFDSPLPSGKSCEAGVACSYLSLRRLPPPIAHIALDGAGFDPTRFSLLARLEENEDGVRIQLPNDTISLTRANARAGILTEVPVTPIPVRDSLVRTPAPGAARHWLLLSVTSAAAAGWRLVLVLLGIPILLFLVQFFLHEKDALIAQKTPSESALALGIGALLTLLLARLIIGARVAFFEPYNDAALDTAIGMWVAIAIVSMLLLRWSRWAPFAIKFCDASFVHVSGEPRAPLLRRLKTMGITFKALLSESRSRAQTQRSLLRAAMFLAVPVVMLWFVSRDAVYDGAACGVAVAGVWFLIAWTVAFNGDALHTFESGPSEVVEYHGGAGTADDATPDNWFWRYWGMLERTIEVDVVALPVLWAATLLNVFFGLVAVALLALLQWQRWARARHHDLRLKDTLWLVVAGQLLSTLGIAVLHNWRENGAMATFLLLILLALVCVRNGRTFAERFRPAIGGSSPNLPAGATTAAASGVWPPVRDASAQAGWFATLILLLPLLLLSPMAAIDMGLLLVMLLPIGAASVLALGFHRITWAGKGVVSLAFVVVAFVLVRVVLFPSIERIKSADARVANARFDEMQTVLGLRPRFVATSLERAAARALATRDQQVAEQFLAIARPGGARDLLVPSIEQVWGARAYAASGYGGVGLGKAVIGGRGIAESVSYAENSFAVFVLHEHGWTGGVTLLLAYFTFAVAVLLAVRRATLTTASLRASRALLLVAALMITIPAVYVALSNVGAVPITGQNMPFLGLNAWSDVTLCAGMIGVLITAALRTEGAAR